MSGDYGTEYYIYAVKEDGWEDLMWYTEDPKEVTENQAMSRYFELVKGNPKGHYRIYKITRPLNNKTLIRDSKGN